MEGRVKNRQDSRESWYRGATDALRQTFEDLGKPLPEKIRFSQGFTSHGNRTSTKGRPIDGQCWHPGASGDGHHEIFISPHLDAPEEVLGVLTHELVHAALPPEVGHGPQYRELAHRVGLEGQMRTARPGKVLAKRLAGVAAQLGPLPHARLDFLTHTMDGGLVSDRKPKQTTRMHRVECRGKGCGYTVRVSAKWLEVGVPHCPLHGPMHADLPDVIEQPEAPEQETAEAAQGEGE